MGNEGSKIVIADTRTLKMVSRLITDYPELGYKTVDEFIYDAIITLLNLKGLQLTQLQTWRKIGDI